MKRKKHNAEQIIKKLREADAMLAAGKTIGQACRALEISEQTFHRWRNQYGGAKRIARNALQAQHCTEPDGIGDGLPVPSTAKKRTKRGLLVPLCTNAKRLAPANARAGT